MIIGYCFGQCNFRTFLSSQKFLLDTANLEPIENLAYFIVFGEVDSPISFLRKSVPVEF